MQTTEKANKIFSEWTHKKSVFKKWFSSLQLGKNHAIAFALTLLVLIVSFLIFNNTSVSYARKWDIEFGFYSILLTFVFLIVGFIVNAKTIPSLLNGRLPSGRSFGILTVFVLIFSVFMFSNIENSHRVLSDETSWESMALQMYFSNSGGVCNEGVWENG